MLVYAATALAIVFTDLLTGVLVGFALTLLKLVLKAARLKIALRYTGDHEAELRLSGAATPQGAGAVAGARRGQAGDHPARTDG